MSLNVFVEYIILAFRDARQLAFFFGIAGEKNGERVAVERGGFDMRAIAIGDGAAERIFECIVGEALEPPMKNRKPCGAGAALENDDALPKWTTNAPFCS